MFARLTSLLKRIFGASGKTAPSGSAREVLFATFGKHPGWDDHIKELNVESRRLLEFERILYNTGIGRGNIDTGAWRNLDEAQRIPFAHLFVWKTADGVVVGRLWASSDGRGRKDYPMVVCLHSRGLPMPWVLAEVLPRLERIEAGCKEATSASDVVSVVQDARAELLRLVEQAEASGKRGLAPAEALAHLSERPEMGPDHEGLLRILYELDRHITSPDAATDKTSFLRTAAPSCHLRVPRCANTLAESISIWLGFLLSVFESHVALLLVFPVNESWVDLIVGEPTSQQLFCLRASLSKIPQTSEIPYKLDADFVARAEKRIMLAHEGASTRLSVAPSMPATPAVPAPKRAGKKLGLLLLCIAIVAAAVIIGVAALLLVSGRPEEEKPPVVVKAPPAPSTPDVESQWRALCKAYQNWIGPLFGDLHEARLRRWRKDPNLKRIVDQIAPKGKAGAELNPRAIAGATGAYYPTVADSLADRTTNAETVGKVERALAEVVGEIKQALSPREWPALRSLTHVIEEYGSRGWNAEKEYLASLASRVSLVVEGPRPRLASAIDDVLAATATVREIEERWRRLEATRKFLQDSGDQEHQDYAALTYTDMKSDAGTSGEEVLRALLNKIKAAEDKLTVLKNQVVQVASADKLVVSEFVEIRQQETIASSAALNEAWQTGIIELGQIFRDVPSIKAEAEELKKSLLALDTELGDPLEPKPEHGEWAKELCRHTEAKRNAMLAQAVGSANREGGAFVRDEEFESNWKGLREDYDDYTREVSRLIEDFTVVESGLIVGCLAHENPPNSARSIARIREDWKGSEPLQDPGVQKALEPVLDRLSKLDRIALLSDRRELAGLANTGAKGEFEGARSSWLRLEEISGPTWPSNLEELKQEAGIREKLEAAYGSVTDEDRKRLLLDELTETGRRRWEICVGSLTEGRDIEAAIDLKYRFAVEVDKLDPWIRYDILLNEFRKDFASQTRDDELREKVGRLVQSLERLPSDFSAGSGQNEFLNGLRKAATDEAGGADVVRSGPAASSLRDRCKARAVEEGKIVEFVCEFRKGRRHTLRFIRIEQQDGAASYLSADEVSVGLFIDAIEAAGQWHEIKQLLPDDDPYRRGIFVWEWERDGSAIRVSDAWVMRGDPKVRASYYAQGIAPGKPSRSHPMQRIPPQAALYFALLLGCRLPTPEEWKAAYDAYEKGNRTPAWNLRDRTWATQRDHIRKMYDQRIPADWSDEDIFWPKGTGSKGRRKTGKNAESHSDRNDGTLWFNKLDADGGMSFHHLVGNVAEFVVPEGFDVPENISAAWVKKSFEKTIRAHVVGGSALSPPNLALEVPYQVDLTEARSGYSDVGCRLAFAAPRPNLSAQVRRILEAQPYLTASSHDSHTDRTLP